MKAGSVRIPGRASGKTCCPPSRRPSGCVRAGRRPERRRKIRQRRLQRQKVRHHGAPARVIYQVPRTAGTAAQRPRGEKILRPAAARRTGGTQLQKQEHRLRPGQLHRLLPGQGHRLRPALVTSRLPGAPGMRSMLPEPPRKEPRPLRRGSAKPKDPLPPRRESAKPKDPLPPRRESARPKEPRRRPNAKPRQGAGAKSAAPRPNAAGPTSRDT